MKKNHKLISVMQKGKNLLMKLQACFFMFYASGLNVYAEEAKKTETQTIFDKATSMMNTIYVSIASISSITAGCVAAVCLYLMFFSKNKNTVEESISWLKRILVCWIAIMLMSTILYFVTTKLGLSVTDLNGKIPDATTT